MSAQQVIAFLKKESNEIKARGMIQFFKTGVGEYGEGDVFIGVTVPQQRIIAKQFEQLPLLEIKKLLTSKIHEHRLTALLILNLQFKKATIAQKKKIIDFYLGNIKYVNNWDLVDSSAGSLLGAYLWGKSHTILYRLIKSDSLWERRIAIIATYYFIGQNDFTDTLAISTLLLSDRHDLIHKAVGWMLREVGKRDKRVLRDFLDRYKNALPRTALRYAIERFPEKLRKHYLEKGNI